MLKELKSFFYLIFIFFFLFLSIKYYFSDEYKKKSYRNFSNLDENLISYSNKLKILENNIIFYSLSYQYNIYRYFLFMNYSFNNSINHLFDFNSF